MVVDDEPDLLKIVEKYLKAWHFEVDAFNNPYEALAYFQKNAASFSLILTDVRMPGMSGLELAQDMLRLKPDIKVMLMTAYETDTLAFQHTLPTVKYEDILHKPFRLQQICNGVRKQLAITS